MGMSLSLSLSLAFALSPDALSPQVVIIAMAVVSIVTVVVATAKYMWRQRALGGHDGTSPLIAFGLVLILLGATALLTAMTTPGTAPCFARVLGSCSPPSATAARSHTQLLPAPLKHVSVQHSMSPAGTPVYPGLDVTLVSVDFSRGSRQTVWALTLDNKGASDCAGITFDQLSLAAITGNETHMATPAGSMSVKLSHGATGIQKTVTFAFADGFAPRAGGPTYTVTLRVNVASCRLSGTVTPTSPSSTPTSPTSTPTASGPPVGQDNFYTLTGFPPSQAA